MNAANKKYVLKILSGPMYGVDLTLPETEMIHLFFADTHRLAEYGQPGSYQHAIIYAENTLFIPAPENMAERFLLRFESDSAITDEEGGNNEDDQQKGSVFISVQRLPEGDEQMLSGDEKKTIPANQPVTVGCMTFAIKEVSLPWSDEVFQYIPSAEKKETIPELTITNDPPEKKKKPRRRLWLTLILLILLGIAVITASYLFTHRDQTSSLYNILRSASPDIIKANDGHYYIIVDTVQKKSWTMHALKKNALMGHKITIIATDVLINSLKKSLRQNNIPFFNIRLIKHGELNILLSEERWPDTAQNNRFLHTLLKNQLVWLKQVNILRISDNTLQKKAEGNIRSAGLVSQQDYSSQYVNYIIRGDIEDDHLNTFLRLTKEFYQQYGDEYIKFVLVLNEDPLRNQSLKVGNNGYILIPGQHWLYADITSKY